VSIPTPARLIAIPDDRDTLVVTDKLILLIEDDQKFASILASKCHERGFKCLAAATGEVGLELASQYLPVAVILDLRLPGIDGLTVLSTLKEDTRTRHIPVHVVSAAERSTDLLRKGAIGHAVKPLDHERLDALFSRLEQVVLNQPKRLLVVEDDPLVRQETVKLIGSWDIAVDEAANGEEGMQALRRNSYDCIVIDLKLPDMDGREMLEQLAREGVALPPVIVHTARDLTVAEERGLRQQAESIVVKDVRSPERLLDEVSLFLHRVVSQMPEQQRQIIRSLHDSDALLQNKKVLIVDDDMRTMFAVSRLLTERGLTPLMAENGERALQLLDEQPGIDLVLMDIMMPVMDGYETMRRIRSQERFRKLPIITLTAKAMPEDRQKCLEAGASDYLPKPIDPDRLFSMMRVWLYG
jgi:CheY-like chemotaxis protein